MMTLILTLLLSTGSSYAAKPKPVQNVKPPSASKGMAFDSQVVEGEVYRPDYSVVTGEAPGEGWGVLRLRSNFRDHAQTDAEENRK